MKRICFVILFFSSLTAFAQPEAALLKKADSLFASQKMDEANAIFTKILKQNPKSEKALKGRAYIFFSQQKWKLAETDYRQVLQLNASCITCYANLSLIKLFTNDTIAASKLVADGLKMDSKSPGLFTGRGRIHFYEEKYDLALQDYQTAIELDSNNAGAYYYKGLLNYRVEEFEKGAADFTKVIRIDSSVADAWFQRGIFFANGQNWDAALSDFTNASKRDSLNSSYVSYAANVYLYKEDPAAAYALYSKAVLLDDKNYEAHYYKSTAAYRMEDMDLSCSCLKTMQSKLPAKIDDEQFTALQNEMNGQLRGYCDTNYAGYYYQRGIAAYNKGQYAKSLQWYNSGLKKTPGHFMMTNFRGNTYLAMGLSKEAEEDYTASLTLTANIDKELNEATSYKDEDPAKQKMYRESVITFTYSSRAEARINNGKQKDAEADAETALKMMPVEMPEKETVYNIRGMLYLFDNDNSNALSFFNKAIQANPGFVPAYINRALVKINLAYKTKVISQGFSIQNKNISTRFDLPTLKKTTVNRDNLGAALVDCSKAIQLDAKSSLAYQVRATIKLLLGEGDYCYDLLKAEQLGSKEATIMISEQKCR